MAKQIVLEYNGTEYTLEYTRKSIETMERQGFIASDIAQKPMSTLPTLFAGAFIARHKWIKKELIDEIFDNVADKRALIEKLAEMYSEPLEALMDNQNAGNGIAWEARF